jgi:uncharacterized protein YjeT (DUF2065 family)
VIVTGAAIGIVLALEGVGVPHSPKPLPGLMTGKAPWGSNTSQLGARLKRLQLPKHALRPAGLAYMKISVGGRKISPPPGIGSLPGRRAPVFTDRSGNIVTTKAPARLELFFKIWGLRFTKSCIGAYCGRLTETVNGVHVPGDPRHLLLFGVQTIVVSIQG